MELKQVSAAYKVYKVRSLNRTFMELKQARPERAGAGKNVLIVPLWN